METMTTQPTALDEAIQNRDTARATFNATKPYTKAWRKAGDELDFWVGKVAFLENAYRRQAVRG